MKPRIETAKASIGSEATPQAAVTGGEAPTRIGAALGSISHTRINLKAARRSLKLTTASVAGVKTGADGLGPADTMAKADHAAAAVADAAAHAQAALDACDAAAAALHSVRTGTPLPNTTPT